MLRLSVKVSGHHGKMPGYLQDNRGKSIILLWYYFVPAAILTLLSYTKIVKIAAIRSVFTPKNSPKCFCRHGSAMPRTPMGKLPRLLVGWGSKTPRIYPTLPQCFRRLNSQRLWRLDTLPKYSLLKIGDVTKFHLI